MLLKNLTQVQELCLSFVKISSVVPNSLTNLSSLTSLDLSATELRGNLSRNIFHLPNLQQLSLGGNINLTVNLPKVNQSSISSIRKLDLRSTSSLGELLESIGFFKSLNYLDLSQMQLPGQLPDSVADLKSLNYLDLSFNNFVGSIPRSIGNLTQITYLFLDKNYFNGQVPSTLSNLNQLNALYLSGNYLEGKIPDCFAKLARLAHLDLSSNALTGPIPPSVSNLVNLTYLDLSSNNLSGVLELDIFPNLQNLEYLSLSNNRLSVSTSTNTNKTLPKLRRMLMSSCKIREFPGFLKSSAELVDLDLSNNEIRGQIPEWFGVIGKDSLYLLNLSNNFLTHIELLGQKNLRLLDLRFNSLEGPLPVPPLDTQIFLFSHNNLSGEIPSSICNLSSLQILDLSRNKLSGEIPSSICNLSSLGILDLSHNNLSGAIPRCFGNFSSFDLWVLDLRSNSLHGNISFKFAKGNNLQTLNLNGNQFEGPLPRSLTNCASLEVLDLGSNKINDMFPKWLGNLPQLKVLVLRSNRFYGPIDTSKSNLSFPMLRIVDLSYNEFTGHLPWRYFQNLIGMKNNTMPNEKYMGNSYYQNSVALIWKGHETELVRILTILTTIDLSSNNFSGEIPNVIGRLNALVLLNLSHNRLDGHIPPSLGELKNLESLDLSSNQLIGKIPNQLMSLTFLAILNLSWNHLDGPIPYGKQFNTFGNNSYAGNLGLCGFPLSKECEAKTVQPSGIFHPEEDSDFATGFTWKIVVIGYGCGMALGLIMGYVMFMTGRPKWFVRIAEGKQQRKVTRIKSFGYRRGGRNKH